MQPAYYCIHYSTGQEFSIPQISQERVFFESLVTSSGAFFPPTPAVLAFLMVDSQLLFSLQVLVLSKLFSFPLSMQMILRPTSPHWSSPFLHKSPLTASSEYQLVLPQGEHPHPSGFQQSAGAVDNDRKDQHRKHYTCSNPTFIQLCRLILQGSID